MRICEWCLLLERVFVGRCGERRLMCCGGLGRKVFVSFGGLLLYMEGPYKNLTPLRIDYVYLCMKK